MGDVGFFFLENITNCDFCGSGFALFSSNMSSIILEAVCNLVVSLLGDESSTTMHMSSAHCRMNIPRGRLLQRSAVYRMYSSGDQISPWLSP